MRVHITKHGAQRLFERVYKKAQNKTLLHALHYVDKALNRGVVTVNDAQQLLVLYANSLYVFKKEAEHLSFVTVKSCEEYRLGTYMRGEKRTFSSKKNFLLCA